MHYLLRQGLFMKPELIVSNSLVSQLVPGIPPCTEVVDGPSYLPGIYYGTEVWSLILLPT